MAAEEATSSGNEASESATNRSPMVSLVTLNFIASLAIVCQPCLMLCGHNSVSNFAARSKLIEITVPLTQYKDLSKCIHSKFMGDNIS